MKKTLLLLTLFILNAVAYAQVSYTADDFILPYEGTFRPGVNPGSTPPWTDEQLADIAAGNEALGLIGAGVKAMRPLMSEEFVERYGYDFKIPTYQYYDQRGLKDNTLIVGFPSEEHREQAYYCPSAQSELFANLYTDIWDNGENGTPVNDENYYALYLYKMLTRYKDYVKFWEIWNEPGFDYTGALGWFPKGADGNWWDNNPDPCDYKLRAPIFHYVRILRISYEVIKTVDPDAYVTLSGIGYPSFLDAILRNTDNPVDGSVTAEFPRGGGSYFDVLGFHSYPHFDGSVKVWSDSINGFLYTRHSDDAAAGITKTKNIFQGVLDEYGYDGATYPNKEWIITECNIPRTEFGDFIGSELAQRNFTMKAYVESELSDILQLHIYRLGEEGKPATAYGEFEVMGLYQHLETTDVGYPIPNESAIAYKTTSDELFGKTYDPLRTEALNLPSHIKGAAFYDENNSYTYVLWAKTLTDRSEIASATYSFPSAIDQGNYLLREWDFSQVQEHQVISGQGINLSSTPIFLREALYTTAQFEDCVGESIELNALNISGVDSWEWSMPGASPGWANTSQVNLSYANPGSYEITLIAKANGSTVGVHTENIRIGESPQANYSSNISGPIGRFTNASSPNVQTYLWDFGDGNTSTDANPQHVYEVSGNYTVSLTVENTCGSHTSSKFFEIIVPSTTMISNTAKEGIDPYNGPFRPGVNLGIYPPWTDEDLADISAGNIHKGIPGIGAKSVRPVLYEEFLDYWGYDIRLETFQHYVNLGMEDNTLIVGFPADHHRDPNFYCPTHQSEHFANMYTDIWDNGENGTPVNDDNYYALYLYNVAIRYGKHVKFWEIWNEPSFDYSSLNGWLPPGQRGNWWENDPYSCDYKLRAPIQHFVRLLRISYEVLKTVDPDAYVTLSGVAFPSFLDAVLRNSDNPVDGAISATYPHKGGAYFDVMGFHSYPHFDGSTSYYDVGLGGWVFNRHSDAAADGLERSQDTLEQVLYQYGYDGNTYPEKHWIVTEANLPRKAFGIFIGSDEAQRNYIIKTFANSVINNFLQLHIYKIAEDTKYDEAGFEFDLMGLYENLKGTDPKDKAAVMTEEGIAYKTSSDILYGATYDPQRTALLQLPNNIGGGAFKDVNDDYTYILWAKTTIDNSEQADATFSFPMGMNINQVTRRAWDYSITQEKQDISSQNIDLTATPIFLSENVEILIPPIAAFRANPASGCSPLSVTFQNISLGAESYEWSFPTGTPSTSTEENPTIVFSTPGRHTAILKAINDAGSHTTILNEHILAETLPVAGFDFYVDGPFAYFNITIENDSTSYYWNFGDGFEFPANDPTHYYFFNGTYEVSMVATNECGSDTTTQSVTISAPTTADFTWVFVSNCPPFELGFKDQSTASPTGWEWSFPGGSPASANVANPNIVFTTPGDYPVTLIVDNGVSLDTITKVVHLAEGALNEIKDQLCQGDTMIINGNIYTETNPSGTEIIPNGSSMGCDSIIQVDLQFNIPDSTYLYELVCFGGIPAPGTYVEVLTNAAGCDSVIVIQVDALPEIMTLYEDSLCEGESIEINGTIYDQNNPSGSEFYTSTLGCDSTLMIVLHFHETYFNTIKDTIVLGETYVFGGNVYLETGVYSDSLQSQNGCDSIAQLDLTVLDTTTSTSFLEQEDFKFKAYPNPFESETLIHFKLPAAARVGLAVFDVHGRQIVDVFQNKNLAAGDHFHKLSGGELSPGIYYCRLQVDGEVLVLRLVQI